MRYAIISDVHSNLEALNAVLEKIEKEKVDDLLFLGDSVGYGPNPNECIDIIKKEARVLLAGNHDHSVLGLTDVEYFNPYAKAALEWTKEVLTNENMAFLNTLPITMRLQEEEIYLVHSTPKEPEQWHYLSNTRDAYINFHFFTERICLAGHSHEPIIIEQLPEGNMIVHKDCTDIKDEHRYIMNVGSVGQPRDGNPDAVYALLDKNSIEIKRVSYDIVLTQKKMRDVGLPSYLIERLARGA